MFLRLCQKGASAIRDRRGQGMVEYALLTALIAVAAITAVRLVGDEVADIFNRILTGLNSL